MYFNQGILLVRKVQSRSSPSHPPKLLQSCSKPTLPSYTHNPHWKEDDTSLLEGLKALFQVLSLYWTFLILVNCFLYIFKQPPSICLCSRVKGQGAQQGCFDLGRARPQKFLQVLIKMVANLLNLTFREENVLEHP